MKLTRFVAKALPDVVLFRCVSLNRRSVLKLTLWLFLYCQQLQTHSHDLQGLRPSKTSTACHLQGSVNTQDDDLPWRQDETRVIVHQTNIGTNLKSNDRETSERRGGVECIYGFSQAIRYDLELNRTTQHGENVTLQHCSQNKACILFLKCSNIIFPMACLQALSEDIIVTSGQNKMHIKSIHSAVRHRQIKTSMDPCTQKHTKINS